MAKKKKGVKKGMKSDAKKGNKMMAGMPPKGMPPKGMKGKMPATKCPTCGQMM